MTDCILRGKKKDKGAGEMVGRKAEGIQPTPLVKDAQLTRLTQLTKDIRRIPRIKDTRPTPIAKDTRLTPFMKQKGGFTSAGVAVALLLTLTLLFTASQVRWIQSQSADIQFVADAGALAGANVVAEYMVIARIADALVLSLGLLGMGTYGVAIVVSCIPFMQAVGAEIMHFGTKVFEARNRCANAAAKALNALQNALPLLVAANSAAVIEANAGISAETAYYRGLAIPLPLTGEDLGFADTSGASGSAEELEAGNERTSEQVEGAEELRAKMDAAKMEGYLADCGAHPGHCQYERANKLAGLSGSSNPFYSTVDTWLFDYAYARAQSYYKQRLAAEKPANQSIDELRQTYCRTRYYLYAIEQLEHGWCHTSDDGELDAQFPSLPKNTQEMQDTTLYTEQAYPASGDGVLHGTPQCPSYLASGGSGYGSVQDLENGTYQQCHECRFNADSIGKVASPTTVNNTGFEFHYRKVAEAAERYQEASRGYKKEIESAKASTKENLNVFEQAMQALKTPRLVPRPPGRNGVIVLVVDTQAHAIPSDLSNSAVKSTASVQPRMAISAAALAEEPAQYGANILASFLDRTKAQMQPGSFSLGMLGAFDGILDIWGSALLAYSRGGDAISEGLVSFLNSIPIVNATPLASWAKSALNSTINALGLQGANLSVPKPLLVNTAEVLQTSDLAPAKLLLAAKQSYASLPGDLSGSLDTALITGLAESLSNQATDLLQGDITLFELSFGDLPGLPTLPITIRLPDAVLERVRGVLDQLKSGLLGTIGGGGGSAVWN